MMGASVRIQIWVIKEAKMDLKTDLLAVHRILSRSSQECLADGSG